MKTTPRISLFERSAVRRVSADPIVVPREGVPFDGNPEITLHFLAWKRMHLHAQSELRHEVGGLLIGDLCTCDPDRSHVVIRDAIPAVETVADATSVVFTLETWKRLLERKSAQFGSAAIVGWYHTHPGFDVFLSSLDLFLHRSFFSRPWHLAFVIDPVNKTAAFFQTTAETVVRREHFNLRLDGSELWETSHVRNLVSPQLPPQSGVLTQHHLRYVLPLTKSSRVVAKGNWLAVTVDEGIILKDRTDNRLRLIQMPNSRKVTALAFDSRQKLHCLNSADREIWMLDPAKPEKHYRLAIEGYSKWKHAFPSQIIFLEDILAIWWLDQWLFFRPDPGGDRFQFISNLEMPNLRLDSTVGNLALCSAGHKLFINTPEQDSIIAVTVGSNSEPISWLGANTGLRAPCSIAATESSLFALDSEGTRIVELTSNSAPVRELLLESSLRERGFVGLTASRDRVYLIGPDGLHEIEISSL